MECVEFLLSHDSDIDYRSPGKYHTALIAAAYYNRVDYVTRLLELNADIAAHRNGRLPSAIAAAAIKGNKAVLQMLLEKEPPKELVNEALVEACAHRQSTSVDLLLSSEADVDFRHPILGTPMQALEAKQADGYNSDLDSDDGNDDTDDEDEDDEEDEDNEDEEEEEEKEDESEDDDASDDDSVDLSNEEEDDEAPETKIRKLLEKNMTRLKRGLTVKRGPSLRRGPSMKKNRLPPGLAAGQPTYTTARSTYEQYKPHTGTGTYPPQQIQQPYHPEPVQHRQSFQAYPGIAHANTERQPQNSLPPTTNATGTYQSPPVNAPSPSICQQQYRPVSNSPSRKPVPNSYPQVPQQQQPNSSMPQRQYSAGVQSEMVPSLPPRTGSQDNIGQRYGLQSPYAEPPLNPGSSGRHQQQQRQSSYTSPQPQYQTTQPTNTSPQPQYQQPPPPQGYTPPAQNIYGSPPHSSYSSPPQQSYTLPQDRTYASPPHPSYPSPPTSQQYANQTGHYQSPPAPQYQAYTSQPPSQGAGYVAYGQQQSQGSSQTSFQSSQYANSSSIGSSQQQMYATPNSSQGTGYNSQMPGQSQKQGQRWATGGYEGEGYG
ncbi:hypothetical protein CC80DRAFT_317184 [Byssothecium circinans]|uniref:Uncharacterized protein n=1 Tax=Byssothecium circinans TaxID=147558 RepID=A0A6A5T9B4_9PLEO|nr:hypothetical protein CC80DRAFT_317184 [Byssothecium circinans]